MLRRGEQKVINNINVVRSIEDIQGILGKEFSKLKVQSMVCQLARRGYIGMGRAKALLKDAVCVKFLSIPFGKEMNKKT